MSRNVSLTLKQAVFAPETDAVFIILLTIDHPNLAMPIRLTSDAVDTVSRGNTFIRFPFDLSLPDDGADRPPRARLTIDNVDRQIVQAIRSISSAPTVLMEIVRDADPNTVEASFPEFKMLEVGYDSLAVSFELNLEQFRAEPWPAALFTPGDFPGLFR